MLADIFSCLGHLILTCFKASVEKSTFWRYLWIALIPGFLNLAVAQAGQSVLEGKTLISSSPNWSDAKQLIKKEKWNEAANVLRVLNLQNPRDASVVDALSAVLIRIGNRASAVQVLLQFSEKLNSKEKQRMISRSQILSRTFISNAWFERYQEGLNALLGKKYRNAQEKFERVLAEDPQNCEVLIKLGQCLILEGEFDAALQRLSLAKSINPTDSEAILWLGKAYLSRGNSKDALRELRSLDPEMRRTEIAVLATAEAQSLAGQHGLALRTLQLDLDEHPLHVRALVFSAKIKLQTARTDLDALWSARKDLQLAWSRVENYDSDETPDREFGLVTRRSAEDLKSEIQKLLQLVQTRIDETPHR